MPLLGNNQITIIQNNSPGTTKSKKPLSNNSIVHQTNNQSNNTSIKPIENLKFETLQDAQILNLTDQAGGIYNASSGKFEIRPFQLSDLTPDMDGGQF